MSGAIVTMVHGAKHLDLWNRYCRESWLAYAAKHDLHLQVLDQLIDDSEFGQSRSATWQKLLIGRVSALQPYDRVVWIDSDIIINADKAPNIFDGIPPGQIGAVPTHVLFQNPLFTDAFHKMCGAWHRTVYDYNISVYVMNGLSPLDGRYVNGGVLAFATRDLAWMEELYYRCQPLRYSFQEQAFLSHEIGRRNLLFQLDPRFNVEWYTFKYSVYGFVEGAHSQLTGLCVRQLFKQSFFLHFNGNQDDMHYFDPASQPEVPVSDKASTT